MKTMNRVLTVAAVTAIVAVAAIGDASATCPNARLFGTFDTDSGTYTYVNLPSGASNATVVGRFWQSDNRAAGNEGTYTDEFWLKVYPASGKWYISGDMAGDGVSGCPNGDLTVTLENNDGSYTSWLASETPAAALWWNLAQFGDKTLTPIARPALSNRTPSGSSVTFNVTAPTGGPSVTGFRLMQRRLTTQQDPGRNPASYTPQPIVAPGGTVPFTIDCTAADQVYLGFQVVYGSGGGQNFGDTIGATANVSCDPNLADPNQQFKMIDKPGSKPRPTRER